MAENPLKPGAITGEVKSARAAELPGQLRRQRVAQKRAASAKKKSKKKKPPANSTKTSRPTHRPVATLDEAQQRTQQWFAANNWQVFDFQRDAWQAWHSGHSGLIHSPTGSGKTLAAWLAPLQQALTEPTIKPGLRVLWITPLRALANDTREQLQAAAEALGVSVDVEIRTGDTSSSRRSAQRSKPPFALITTPESLSVMLSYPDSGKTFGHLQTVVVDEWHELLGSKRGVQLQLCLARLRAIRTRLCSWGISATLANLNHAMQALTGTATAGRLIRGLMPKTVQVESVLPATNQHFKWSGHLGIQLVEEVTPLLEQAGTTLVFTNTRSQAELWCKALLEQKPLWKKQIALHHGSLDRDLRTDIENRLRDGLIRCVVCTSSLDLGVDFSPVDQVVQIGSPKGVARLLQRAGRSGHRPGSTSRVVCVPTHAFELVEIAAVRSALQNNRIEARESPTCCLDVLSQHLVTIAMGGGFDADSLLTEVRSTVAYQSLTDDEWLWVLDFITRGGQALQGYPQYHKVVSDSGIYKVVDRTIAQRHRMSIGTITSDAQIAVAFQHGKRLGSTEESFITRLRPGDTFQFAGKHLQLIRVRDMTAHVKLAKGKSRVVPRWQGTQMPISNELADGVLDTLCSWRENSIQTPELQAVAGMLQLQQRWSKLPGPNDFLVEQTHTREGDSLFFFPFAGRLAHEGLAMLVAQRLSEHFTITVRLQVNDYGFELQCPGLFADHLSIDEPNLKPLFNADNLLDDILASVNSGEIAKRQFRGIANIAGLVFSGYPGKSKSARQVQASSGLLFDVFERYDQHNRLLDQAKREVLEQQLEYQRIKNCLLALQERDWHIIHTDRLTPLSFPLWAGSLQGQTFSSESFEARVNRMLLTLEKAAAKSLTPS